MRYITLLDAAKLAARFYSYGDSPIRSIRIAFRFRKVLNKAFDYGVTEEDIDDLLDQECSML